jgi:hypothetical protein
VPGRQSHEKAVRRSAQTAFFLAFIRPTGLVTDPAPACGGPMMILARGIEHPLLIARERLPSCRAVQISIESYVG